MAKSIQPTLQALESVIQKQLEIHEYLIESAPHKREALQKADLQWLTQLCQLENEKVQALSELEKKRLEIAARLTLLVKPGSPEPMRMREIAQCLSGPAREKLLLLRDELIKRMQQVKQQTTVARRASDALMKHVQGVVQNIGAMTTGVSTYVDNGQRPSSATAVSTFSMTA